MTLANRPPLMLHQADDVAWARRVGRGLLGNDPGTGKTRSMIEVCDGGRTLVLAPAMVVAGGTWADELARWADHPELFTVVPYTQIGRRGERGAVTRAPKPEYRGPWDSMILDEAHYIKGRDTSWSVVAHKLSLQADQLFCVTGSPIPNWMHELYMPLKLIHRGKRGDDEFGSFWRWAERWFVCAPTRFSRGFPAVGELLGCQPTWRKCRARPATDPCQHYIDFAEANLGDRYRRVLETDVLDLPPKREITVKVPLSPSARRIYKTLAKDFLAQYRDGTEVVAWSRGELNYKLDQVTTSPWLTQEPDARRPVPHGGKFDRLAHDLTDGSGPALVVTAFRATADACATLARSLGRGVALAHGGTNAGAAVRAFKNGDVDCLVGTVEVLAEGHQLTRARTEIIVEQSYKPYRNTQVRRRIWRMGQDQPVRILTYVAPDTVDEAKLRRLHTKIDRQTRALTAAEFARMI